MSRKTLPVTQIVERANEMLAAPGSTPEGREAICVMVESLLLEAGRYGGFRYLPTTEVLGAGSRRVYMVK